MKVQVKKLHPEAKLPEYQTPGSAGMDVFAFIGPHPVAIDPWESEIIPTGISVAIPEGYEIQVRSRSGLASSKRVVVLNSPGTIDSDYRGEVKVLLYNHGNEQAFIEPGQRIAQLVLAKVERSEWQEVDSLPVTERGQHGFGSTGK
jgi:dUTP pyrophosphatase